MTAPELTDDQVWAWWCRQRAALGLRPEITDPAVIGRVVTLALTGLEHDDAGADREGGDRASSS